MKNIGGYRIILSSKCQSAIEVKQCKRTLTGGSRRNHTLKYRLGSIDVCKQFFISTLNISGSAISSFVNKSAVNDYNDKRGRHKNHRKLDPVTRNLIKSHIESFPSMESHYVRAKSTRLYLAAYLNIAKMWSFFNKMYPSLKVTDAIYRKFFCNEYNFSFHKPKKDLCSTCVQYDNSDKTDLRLQASYKLHFDNKEAARIEKNADKIRAIGDPEIKVYTISSPCSLLRVGQLVTYIMQGSYHH